MSGCRFRRHADIIVCRLDLFLDGLYGRLRCSFNLLDRCLACRNRFFRYFLLYGFLPGLSCSGSFRILFRKRLCSGTVKVSALSRTGHYIRPAAGKGRADGLVGGCFHFPDRIDAGELLLFLDLFILFFIVHRVVRCLRDQAIRGHRAFHDFFRIILFFRGILSVFVYLFLRFC